MLVYVCVLLVMIGIAGNTNTTLQATQVATVLCCQRHVHSYGNRLPVASGRRKEKGDLRVLPGRLTNGSAYCLIKHVLVYSEYILSERKRRVDHESIVILRSLIASGIST